MAINNVVSNSSNTAILRSFEKIVRDHIPNRRWLGEKNYYLNSTTQRTNSPTSIADVKIGQLTDYISASVVLHCYDGWNFISRAVESLINNDISSAIHLLYYGELRAVMSFMAYQGIGIFDNKHYWFDSIPNCAMVEVQPNNYRIGTHSIAEKCLIEWSQLSTKKEQLFNLIQIKNKKLSSWIDATGSTTRNRYSSEVIKKWVKDWSIDLKLKPDQELRNETSYRPHFNNAYLSTRSTLERLETIWKAIEPTDSSRFNILDLHLSRIALERVFSNSTGRSHLTNKDRYISFINKMFNRIGEPLDQYLHQFLLREAQPDDHFLIVEGRKNSNNNNRPNLKDPFPMLCRAILLMRLSSGCVYELFENSTLQKKNLRYWWEDICNNIGIASSIDEEVTPTDLYIDIKDAFDDIFARSNNGELNSLYTATTNFGSEFDIIKQFQRACFWGIGL